MTFTLAFALALVPLAPSGGVPIHWGARTLEMDALPPELPTSARLALEGWHDWARAHDYRLDLDGEGRILLVCRRANDRAPKLLELAVRVIERFDQELPAPAVRLAPKAPDLKLKEPEKQKPAGGAKPLPEDPENPEGDHPWKLPPPKPAPVSTTPTMTWTWGAAGQPIDSQTVVLFLAFDDQDFQSLLLELAKRFTYLETWIHAAKALQGFVLGQPLAGAYMENPPGVEEWNPDNELVSRLARLCLLRRYGELPNWVAQGYAWHMEFALMGTAYVFPWRDEFVSVTEHSGWGKVVADRYAKKRLKPADFMGWHRGKYLEPEAKASWATCEYLLAKEKAKTPELLDRLRVFGEEHGRIQDDPSSWRRDVDYEIPATDQHQIFVQVLGDTYLERATNFFRQELAP